MVKIVQPVVILVMHFTERPGMDFTSSWCDSRSVCKDNNRSSRQDKDSLSGIHSSFSSSFTTLSLATAATGLQSSTLRKAQWLLENETLGTQDQSGWNTQDHFKGTLHVVDLLCDS